MASRATMYFELGVGGWTESFYTNLDVNPAIAAGRALAAKRATLLVEQGVIRLVGARSLTNPRVAAADWDQPAFTGTVGGSLRRDLFQAAVEIRLASATHASKPWLHGLPDEWMVSPPGSPTQFRLTATGTLAVNAYLDFLFAAQTWLIRGLTVPLDDATPKIQAITQAGAFLVLAIPGSTLAAGDRVQINSCKGFRTAQFNGLYRVESNILGVVTISSLRGIAPGFLYVPTSGRIRRSNKGDYGLFPIEQLQQLRVGSKKIGRPTLAPHGRQSRARR